MFKMYVLDYTQCFIGKKSLMFYKVKYFFLKSNFQ